MFATSGVVLNLLISPFWREDLLFQKLLCFNCLRSAHKAVNWKLKKRCQECNKSHNTLFHENTPTVNEESDQRPVVVLTNRQTL